MAEARRDLARKAGPQTAAEGVESRPEWDLLKAPGCDPAQGCFIAQPMPGHPVPGWVELWQAPQATPPL